MMDRNRLSFWTRLVAIVLAAGFLFSSVLIGFSATGSYNLLDVIGNNQQQQQAQQQTQDLGPQIQQAKQKLKQNPKDPAAIKDLATLYISDGQTSKGISTLEDGMKSAPKDAEIPLILGQAYYQQAQSQGQSGKTFKKAGDAFAAATERDPKNSDAFIYAGQSYEQAGDPGKAIQYYNGYLDLKPKGSQAKAVKDRIQSLLDQGGSTGGSSSSGG